ncbi:hypothetical protein, partial [Mycolicibacterium pallens]|uniref:hypothetical protein n=1 Tax=Mycolicibacterium pallens TaxID=370524 RepID=UPI0031D38421
PTANSPRTSLPYSGPRPINPKLHSDWTTKRVPLTSGRTSAIQITFEVGIVYLLYASSQGE